MLLGLFLWTTFAKGPKDLTPDEQAKQDAECRKDCMKKGAYSEDFCIQSCENSVSWNMNGPDIPMGRAVPDMVFRSQRMGPKDLTPKEQEKQDAECRKDCMKKGAYSEDFCFESCENSVSWNMNGPDIPMGRAVPYTLFRSQRMGPKDLTPDEQEKQDAECRKDCMKKGAYSEDFCFQSCENSVNWNMNGPNLPMGRAVPDMVFRSQRMGPKDLTPDQQAKQDADCRKDCMKKGAYSEDFCFQSCENSVSWNMNGPDLPMGRAVPDRLARLIDDLEDALKKERSTAVDRVARDNDDACENYPDWADSYGDSCTFYEQEADACELSGLWVNLGISANEACCVCGGGSTSARSVRGSGAFMMGKMEERAVSDECAGLTDTEGKTQLCQRFGDYGLCDDPKYEQRVGFSCAKTCCEIKQPSARLARLVLRTARDPSVNNPTWTVEPGSHCYGTGGALTYPEAVEYGWKPGNGGVNACKAKCESDMDCTGFVWRPATKDCFWTVADAPRDNHWKPGTDPRVSLAYDCYYMTDPWRLASEGEPCQADDECESFYCNNGECEGEY